MEPTRGVDPAEQAISGVELCGMVGLVRLFDDNPHQIILFREAVGEAAGICIGIIGIWHVSQSAHYLSEVAKSADSAWMSVLGECIRGLAHIGYSVGVAEGDARYAALTVVRDRPKRR